MFRIDTRWEEGYTSSEDNLVRTKGRRPTMKITKSIEKIGNRKEGEEMTRLTIAIDRDLRSKLKILCAMERITMKELVTNFIERSVRESKLPG